MKQKQAKMSLNNLRGHKFSEIYSRRQEIIGWVEFVVFLTAFTRLLIQTHSLKCWSINWNLHIGGVDINSRQYGKLSYRYLNATETSYLQKVKFPGLKSVWRSNSIICLLKIQAPMPLKIYSLATPYKIWLIIYSKC